LKTEVLSTFYGCNRFIFKASEQAVLQAYRMTLPTEQKLWRNERPDSQYLQKVSLEFTAQKLPLDTTITFVIKKLHDGGVEITHNAAEKTSYCCCHEDAAVAETLIDARGESDPMHAMKILCAKRIAKLTELGAWEYDGMYRVPPTRCEHCGKSSIRSVGGG